MKFVCLNWIFLVMPIYGIQVKLIDGPNEKTIEIGVNVRETCDKLRTELKNRRAIGEDDNEWKFKLDSGSNKYVYGDEDLIQISSNYGEFEKSAN